MNWIVIRKQKNSYHSQRNASFDILNLVNQLHKLRSIYPKGV